MTTVTSHTEIPSTEKLAEISKIEVWDEEGKKVDFGSVYENEKTVVIFIRALALSLYSGVRRNSCCYHRSFLMRSKRRRGIISFMMACRRAMYSIHNALFSSSVRSVHPRYSVSVPQS